MNDDTVVGHIDNGRHPYEISHFSSDIKLSDLTSEVQALLKAAIHSPYCSCCQSNVDVFHDTCSQRRSLFEAARAFTAAVQKGHGNA